jgi:hypothetical protein
MRANAASAAEDASAASSDRIVTVNAVFIAW